MKYKRYLAKHRLSDGMESYRSYIMNCKRLIRGLEKEDLDFFIEITYKIRFI